MTLVEIEKIPFLFVCVKAFMSAFACVCARVCVCVCWHPIAPGSCPVPNEIKKYQKKERLKKNKDLEIDKKGQDEIDKEQKEYGANGI